MGDAVYELGEKFIKGEAGGHGLLSFLENFRGGGEDGNSAQFDVLPRFAFECALVFEGIGG